MSKLPAAVRKYKFYITICCLMIFLVGCTSGDSQPYAEVINNYADGYNKSDVNKIQEALSVDQFETWNLSSLAYINSMSCRIIDAHHYEGTELIGALEENGFDKYNIGTYSDGYYVLVEEKTTTTDNEKPYISFWHFTVCKNDDSEKWEIVDWRDTDVALADVDTEEMEPVKNILDAISNDSREEFFNEVDLSEGLDFASSGDLIVGQNIWDAASYWPDDLQTIYGLESLPDDELNEIRQMYAEVTEDEVADVEGDSKAIVEKIHNLGDSITEGFRVQVVDYSEIDESSGRTLYYTADHIAVIKINGKWKVCLNL